MAFVVGSFDVLTIKLSLYILLLGHWLHLSMSLKPLSFTLIKWLRKLHDVLIRSSWRKKFSKTCTRLINNWFRGEARNLRKWLWMKLKKRKRTTNFETAATTLRRRFSNSLLIAKMSLKVNSLGFTWSHFVLLPWEGRSSLTRPKSIEVVKVNYP